MQLREHHVGATLGDLSLEQTSTIAPFVMESAGRAAEHDARTTLDETPAKLRVVAAARGEIGVEAADGREERCGDGEHATVDVVVAHAMPTALEPLELLLPPPPDREGVEVGVGA